MKQFSLLAILAFLFFSSTASFGQKNTLSRAQLAKTYTFHRNDNPALSHESYFDAMAPAMQLPSNSTMTLEQAMPDQSGYTHFRYQQYLEGLPIFGNHYTLHEKDGKVVTATGRYTPQTTVDAAPAINVATAIAFAKRDMNAQEYDPRPIQPTLCFIDPAFPQTSETLRLAYQVDLISTDPYNKRRYFVDAHSGKIISEFPLILEQGVPSTAKTRYYGVRNIVTDSLGPQDFVLRDPTRSEGIFIFNSESGSTFTNSSSHWDLTNANGDEVALDAHFCTQEYYDMMLADYDWRGQDGNGKALTANVHAGDFVNAFWNGESTTYGDGDCNYGPLTTLEVVGHEFTHGVIDYTSKLIYSGESGAINESLADMFGKLLEHRTDPGNFSWSLAHSFALSPDSEPFRVLDDPNSVQMPAFYKGQFWVDGADVHTNSSIGNLWFSMLADGKQGVNENGVAFNVPQIGFEKIGQIVFQTNRYYLSESSDYAAFYQFSIDVAETLYGAGSSEAQAVAEAWKAVGLPSAPSGDFDLAITGNGFFSESICDTGSYIPVQFTITNTSGVTYTPSMMGSVTLSNFDVPDYVVDLNSTLAPGESFDLQVNDWLLASSAGFKVVFATLNILDEKVENNSTTNYYEVVQFPANDLGLYVDLPRAKCFDTAQQIGLFVSNESCEPVPNGTALYFSATDDFFNEVWVSPPHFLVEDLEAGSAIYVPYEIPVFNVPLNFILTYAPDPEPTNNLYSAGQKSYLPITTNYLNDFEVNGGQDDYLQLENVAGNSTLLYLSSHYFASSGYYEDPEAFQRCADPLKVFSYESAEGINASIHTCVDFSFSDEPVLEFDVAEFRNTFADATNDDFSSMVQARWTGNGSGNQVILGQPEGAIEHYSISLPPYFKGALDLRLYTELGHWGLNPIYLADDDFVLLDNLKLTAPPVSTNEPGKGSTLQVLPNPARDKVLIQDTEGIRSILLQNLNGQTLKHQEVGAPSREINLQGLASGVYLLHVQLENGAWEARKLVKMD